MNPTLRTRISALVLLLVLSAIPALAVPPCSCNYCQRFPDRTCTLDGADTTCLDFLIVAICPASSAAAPSSKEVFLATLSGQPTQQPARCLTPTS